MLRMGAMSTARRCRSQRMTAAERVKKSWRSTSHTETTEEAREEKGRGGRWDVEGGGGVALRVGKREGGAAGWLWLGVGGGPEVGLGEVWGRSWAEGLMNEEVDMRSAVRWWEGGAVTVVVTALIGAGHGDAATASWTAHSERSEGVSNIRAARFTATVASRSSVSSTGGEAEQRKAWMIRCRAVVAWKGAETTASGSEVGGGATAGERGSADGRDGADAR